jgi:hypothetical protein
LCDLRLVGAGINPCKYLPLADVIVEVRQHRRDLTGNLAADLHRGNCTQCAGGGNGHPDLAAVHHGGPVRAGLPLAFVQWPVSSGRNREYQQDDDDDASPWSTLVEGGAHSVLTGWWTVIDNGACIFSRFQLNSKRTRLLVVDSRLPVRRRGFSPAKGLL